MDLALIYATGKRAILTLEKDSAADEMFKDTFEVWSTHDPLQPTSYVFLASDQSEAGAKNMLAIAQERWSSLWGDLSPVIDNADLGPPKGMRYRVRLPVPSSTEATLICAKIKANGGDCFVTRE